MFKFLVVLCLGVLAVQAKPKLGDQWDDLLEELDKLNREATEEQVRSLDRLSSELAGLQGESSQLLHDLGEDLRHDVDRLLEQIDDLEKRAERERVDIHECIGTSGLQISDLSARELTESQECAERRYDEASHAIDEAVGRVTEATGHFDEYYKQIDDCRHADPREQNECVGRLQEQIRRDAVEIPSLFHTTVEEAVGRIEAEKGELIGCTAGKAEKAAREGEHIVERVVDCAERIFPPGPGPNPQ